MKNISLNFFGEEVSINMPTNLASLRQQISEKFMFSPSDAAEIIVSYAKDLGKKIIQTEQDFVNFISEKINKIDLDISQDSKLYKKSFVNLQKETEDGKKELELALKKKEEIKKRRETALNKRTQEIKDLEAKINELKKQKKELEKLSRREEKQFCKEEKINNKKIATLQEKLGLKKTKLKSVNVNKVHSMMERCFNAKNEEYQKLEKIPIDFAEKTNKIIRKIIEHKLKKMHDFEKEIQEMKLELKPEEKEFFINYPQLCNDIGRRVDGFTNYIKCEATKLFEEIHKIKKNQYEIVCPLKKKLEQKGKKVKKEVKKDVKKEVKKEENKKEVHWFVTCDGCKMCPLMGKRYKCDVCPNFDFCEECYKKEKDNHKHSFKMVNSRQFFKQMWEKFKKGETMDGRAIHHGYICDGCDKGPIIGNRYKCTVCDDFDYCEACEEKFRDQHKHPFLKIYKPSMDPVSIKCVIPEMEQNKK